MEGNIVLGHELVELHIFRVLPPSLPLLGVARRDREIATGNSSNNRRSYTNLVIGERFQNVDA